MLRRILRRNRGRRNIEPSPYPELYFDTRDGEWSVRYLAVNDNNEIELVELCDYAAMDHTDHVIADVGCDAYLLNTTR